MEMGIKEFIDDYREAFGSKAPLPLVFGYSDRELSHTEKTGGCLFKTLQMARDGKPVSLSAENIACGGGRLYTGFSPMPERVPRFVSLTEKYKQTPEMVVEYVERLAISPAEKAYLNFVRIDQAESFEGYEALLFFATPDLLSGLCGLAFYDNNSSEAVVSLFGSGCGTVVSTAVAENRRGGSRCFLGLFDPSVRPFVGRDELGFTVPMSRFAAMTATMRECFLFDSPAWTKVKRRLEER